MGNVYWPCHPLPLVMGVPMIPNIHFLTRNCERYSRGGKFDIFHLNTPVYFFSCPIRRLVGQMFYARGKIVRIIEVLTAPTARRFTVAPVLPPYPRPHLLSGRVFNYLVPLSRHHLTLLCHPPRPKADVNMLSLPPEDVGHARLAVRRTFAHALIVVKDTNVIIY